MYVKAYEKNCRNIIKAEKGEEYILAHTIKYLCDDNDGASKKKKMAKKKITTKIKEQNKDDKEMANTKRMVT